MIYISVISRNSLDLEMNLGFRVSKKSTDTK